MESRSLSRIFGSFACTILVVCILLHGSGFAFESSVVDRPVRKLNMTLKYKTDIKGKKGTVFTLISLVPQTIDGKQIVEGLAFNPEPKNVYLHEDNKYAEWKFKGKEMPAVIEIMCRLQLYQYNLEEQTLDETLGSSEKRTLLNREKYLDVGKRNIKIAAKKIPNKESDVEQAKVLTRAVVKRMKPTNATREMLGAEKAYKARKGDCTEYTDLLVTLARQKGLPAKHVSGYIVTKATSVGHSWAEIYTDEQGWITVDPLHIELKKGSFKQLENKYITLSETRNDRELGGGMLYSWNVKNGYGAKVSVEMKVEDR